MKIVFTFDWPILQTRAIEWYNFLTHLGHEVYLFQPTELSKQVFSVFNTKISYTDDEKILEEADYWFYDLSPDNSKPVTEWKYLKQIRSFKGVPICINYEDGYAFFVKRIDHHLMDRTAVFIGNALYLNRDNYAPAIRKKLFLTTAYITNSQSFKQAWEWVPFFHRKKRVYFSGALTGFPTYLTNNSEEEYKLRYTLCKIVKDAGLDHVVRFAAADPRLQKLYDETIPEEWKQTYIGHTQYITEFVSSRFCLAVKGNSFPTNRFYESQAAACVTLTNPLHGEIEFYGTGIAGKDYVEIKADGSDLIEKVNYYSEHDSESEVIADNGRRNWEIYNMLDERGIWSDKTLNYHIDGIKAITGIDLTNV